MSWQIDPYSAIILAMKDRLKNFLYFPLAGYFAYFAKIQLQKWKPQIIVITGSNGKTTTLEMVKSQLKDRAKYSDNANSSYGIPFDILGIKRKSYNCLEWIAIFFSAISRAFHNPYSQNIYVVEADCDRPGEGKFLSGLLRADYVIWLSSDRTHSMNYDKEVESRKFHNVDQAIAYEYGYFVRNNPKFAIINADNNYIFEQSKKLNNVLNIKLKKCKNYQLSKAGSSFSDGEHKYTFSNLLPEKSFYSIIAAIKIAEYLKIQPDYSFEDFKIPPSRSSIFDGSKNTTLIDSSYNANYSSTATILSMVEKINNPHKWFVFGGMLEQGREEKEEHEKLIPEIKKVNFELIILVGEVASKYLGPEFKNKSISFSRLPDALKYLQENLSGGELILFKGGRMEGLVEKLLKDKSEASKLCRRENVYAKKRKAMGIS